MTDLEFGSLIRTQVTADGTQGIEWLRSGERRDPGEGGYRAAVAIKALGFSGAPGFHAVLPGQTFKTAHDADLAAVSELERLVDVDTDGEPVWPLD